MPDNGTPLRGIEGIPKMDALMMEDRKKQTNHITIPQGLAITWQDPLVASA